jgi:putative RecB family exonuclease
VTQPEQLTLGSMPRRLFAATPSRLAAFDCPRRYRMTYLDRPTPSRGAPWAHNTLGAVVHLALHRWWMSPRAVRTAATGALLVVRNWQSDGFRDEAQSRDWRTRASQWVAGYLSQIDPDDEPAGVERTVATVTERLALSGRVDRIDDRDGELVIVDYKTGRRPPDGDEARSSQALALYALAARRTLRRPCRRVELHHVPTGRVAVAEHSDESLARHVARAEATADDIVVATDTWQGGAHRDEMFPPVPGPGCSWCDFRKHCPEGRAAAPDRDPWAGLPELAGAAPGGFGPGRGVD